MSGFKAPAMHAPLLGEHNPYVLGEILGLSDDEISELRQKEIIM
jgi:crotonobetainyl-CoA:carnitine CoA-transferase CaiB-like acyl-CoA transferase